MNLLAPPLDDSTPLPAIAPCEHIAGNEKFIKKGFKLQEQFLAADQTSHVDLTLDLEDGAPVGKEEELRAMCAELLHSKDNTLHQVGVRIHALTSPHACRDLEELITKAGNHIKYITVPKIRSASDARWAQGLIQHYASSANLSRTIPLHLLIETNSALSNLSTIARLSNVETFDFGLMDFVSQCGGVIPASAMRSPDQFTHPLITSTKQHIALTALHNGIVPSHNVTVDFRNAEQVYNDARTARTLYGFLRMWSIHPEQIAPIISGILPTDDERDEAKQILEKAARASWGPIEHNGRLHDRASYRYYWSIISRTKI